MSRQFDKTWHECNISANPSMECDLNNFTYVKSYNISENATDWPKWTYPLVNTNLSSFLIVTYVLVFLMCFFGNLIVLFVITSNSRMRSRTNLFLANLAIADLCVGIFCILPALYKFIYKKWYLGQVVCKLYKFVENMNITASMLLLELMAVERYIAINHPLKARRLFTQYKMYFAQIFVWVVSGVYNCPFLLIYGIEETHENNETNTFCAYIHDPFYHDAVYRVYYVCTFVLWYLVPLLTMSGLYFKIARTLWKSGVKHHMIAMRRRIGSVASSNISEDMAENVPTLRTSVAVRHPRSLPDVQPMMSLPEAAVVTDEEDNDEPDRENLVKNKKADTSKASTVHGSSPSCSRQSAKCCNVNLGTLTNAVLKMDSKRSERRSSPERNLKDLRSPSKGYHGAESSTKLVSRFSYSSNSSDEMNQTNAEISLHASQPLKYNTRKASAPETSSCAATNAAARPKPKLLSNTNLCRFRVKSQQASRRRVIVLLLVLVVTFAVLILPNHIKQLMTDPEGHNVEDATEADLALPHKEAFKVEPPDIEASVFFSIVCPLLMYLNCALNPVLYSLLSQSFRRSLTESFTRCTIRKTRPRKANIIRIEASTGNNASNTKRTSC